MNMMFAVTKGSISLLDHIDASIVSFMGSRLILARSVWGGAGRYLLLTTADTTMFPALYQL